MGKKNRRHYSANKDPDDLLWVTLCGQLVTTRDRTDLPLLVTCKRCEKKLQKTETHVHRAVVTALNETRRGEESGLFDLRTGLPVMNPAMWKRRDCTCGTCGMCKHLAAIKREQFAAPWAERKNVEAHTWRWSSVNEALGWYADTIEDGYPEQSLGEALERLGKMGATIQSSSSRDSRAIQDADDRAAVEKALYQAVIVEPDVDGRDALLMLFEVAVGVRVRDKSGRIARKTAPDADVGRVHNISGQAVGNLVKRLKRRVRAALGDWGMLK